MSQQPRRRSESKRRSLQLRVWQFLGVSVAFSEQLCVRTCCDSLVLEVQFSMKEREKRWQTAFWRAVDRSYLNWGHRRRAELNPLQELDLRDLCQVCDSSNSWFNLDGRKTFCDQIASNALKFLIDRIK